MNSDRTPRPRRPLLIIIMTALLAAAGLLLAVGQAVPARAAAASGAKPTIVLEHGAWADGSSWSGVVARLQALGYTVDVPPNPLRGLPSDAAYLSDFLSTISGPVVLVGHSYGGMVTSNAAAGSSQVKALVYVDANEQARASPR